MAESASSSGPKNDPEEEEEFVLTPEVMRRENRRIDLILAGGLLLFSFFLGCFRDDGADLWMRLKSGEIFAATFPSLPDSDSLSYTAEGKPWVCPWWLFNTGAERCYSTLGPAGLIFLKALLVSLIALTLLWVRHSGPTLWWSVMVASLAMIGFSSWLSISPEVVGLFFLGLLLLVWFQARYRQRFGLIYLAIPVAVLWANSGMGYVLVALFLLLMVLGEVAAMFLPAWSQFGSDRLSKGQIAQLFGVALLCWLAGMVTPYGWSTLTFPFEWFGSVLPEVPKYERVATAWAPLSWKTYFESLQQGTIPWQGVAWGMLIVGGLSSFVLNLPRLPIGRFLVTLLALGLPMLAHRLEGFSALLLAYALSLNAQEFFLSRFGDKTRIETPWFLWSQIGRALSIVLIFVALVGAFTGRLQGMVGRFGLGFDMSRYMVDADAWLSEVRPKGNQFAFSNRIASYLAWGNPERRNFVDSRWQVYGDVLDEYSEVRQALVQRKPETWKKTFADEEVSMIIIDPSEPGMELALKSMLATPELAPLYVSDAAVVFGDVSSLDKDLIEANRIRANKAVFREDREAPQLSGRFVSEPGIIDWLWRTRLIVPKNFVSGSVFLVPNQTLERPGRDYLGLTELRNSVANQPDSPRAYLRLGSAFSNIFVWEREALARAAAERMLEREGKTDKGATEQTDKTATNKSKGADATPDAAPSTTAPTENAPAKRDTSAQANAQAPTTPRQLVLPPSRVLLPLRHYQMMFAYQSAAIAGTEDAAVHLKLFDIALANRHFDVALQQLQEALEKLPKGAAGELESRYLPGITKEVDARRRRYDELVAQQKEQLAKAGVSEERPLERAALAMQLELPLLAMEQLELVGPFGPESQEAARMIGPLYLELGFAEKAFAKFRDAGAGRRTGFGTGQWNWFMGVVQNLQGNYEEAIRLLEVGLAELRFERMSVQLSLFEQTALAGNLMTVTGSAQTLAQSRSAQSDFSLTLGMMRLEAGEPNKAKEAFEQALKLTPRFQYRPLIAAYWSLLTDEKLGEAPGDLMLEDLLLKPAKPSASPASAKAEGPPTEPQKPEAPVTEPSEKAKTTTASPKTGSKSASPKTESKSASPKTGSKSASPKTESKSASPKAGSKSASPKTE
ncbi:Tetratricopeptide repeat protein [Planctomycetes bacterium Pan216]|uniref:Tetratricopeptide repeat protein n=1 Tax=Kolteria novifilia TaxID=2527975 RepID=A0A518B3L4_9BACT|nr:Tetratricopeptide repeat protein [Planctomycetes bacterium Pan216]